MMFEWCVNFNVVFSLGYRTTAKDWIQVGNKNKSALVRLLLLLNWISIGIVIVKVEK